MAGVHLGVFHDNTNMGATRLCFLLAVLVSVKMMAAQPTFGTKFWCDTFCDDDDDDDYDSSSSGIEDIFAAIFDPCAGCDKKKPSKSKTTTTVAPGTQQPFSIMIPPANGMNVTMTNTGMSWLMNFVPWAAKPATATTAAAATTAAPATTAAGTTAAGGTTAAATTAKA